MLFGYPIAATQNNWLHDCICEAVRAIHHAIDAGTKYPGWPAILPAKHRKELKSRTGLRDRLEAYNTIARRFDRPDREVVLAALDSQNRIGDLLSGICACSTLEDLPKGIRRPLTDLFGFAFDLLSEFGIRDKQYEVVYSNAADHVCPFCGTEYFDAPGAAREPLDHYLTRSLYVFAAANLRNLVPMGTKCNSSYKGGKDLLHSADGSRRVAVDPYNHGTVRVSLDASEPFDGSTPNTPRWKVKFDPETPAVSTWDEVFLVAKRYQRDHLDPSFASWLGSFGKWVRSSGLQTDTKEALVHTLQKYETLCNDSGMQDRGFLKAAVFRMLRLQCESGHQRLLQQLRDLLTPPARATKDAA